MSDSTRKKNHQNKTENDTVSFIAGASAIEIGDIKRTQATELDQDLLSDLDLDMDLENDLDKEALNLKNEFDADPEMKDDVLKGYDASISNDQLEKIAEGIEISEIEQTLLYKKVAGAVSDEMIAINDQLIIEDQALEAQVKAETQMADEAVEIEELSESDQELRSALPKISENGDFDLDDLASCIEALLFYSDRPVSLKKLKAMLEMESADDAHLLAAIDHLKLEFSNSKHGFEIAEIAGGYQLRTKAIRAPLLRKLAKVQVQRLSRGAMETLTLVAYQQPCTKDQIDQVRGVDSSHFIRTLLDRKLIEVTGRSEAVGRPMLYATTDTFLEVFSLMDLNGLPSLREIEAMVPQLAAQEEGAEDPRVMAMKKMVQQMKTESNHLDYDSKEDDQILQDIRDRVKSIDISTPFLEAQKEMNDQGLSADEILAIQVARSQGMPDPALATEKQSELL